MLETPLTREGGYMVVPDGPGLGVDLDRAITEMPYARWKYPADVRMRNDGSVFRK
jgi:L-alanine-DL-glutamate epimerase-like enolase superfamily enzyme